MLNPLPKFSEISDPDYIRERTVIIEVQDAGVKGHHCQSQHQQPHKPAPSTGGETVSLEGVKLSLLKWLFLEAYCVKARPRAA